MATKAQRRLEVNEIRRFGSDRKALEIPDLTKIQTESYSRFLQFGTPSDTTEASDATASGE